MIRRSVRTCAAAVFAVILISATTASGSTTPNPGDHGHHVASCAKTFGFDGMHNPGMHQGFSQWKTHHECMH